MTPVAEDAHARFHAREREYRYFIEPRKNPFTRHETWQYYVPLDVGRMNEAAAMLTAYDDFTSFAKLNSNNKTNICRVRPSGRSTPAARCVSRSVRTGFCGIWCGRW